MGIISCRGRISHLTGGNPPATREIPPATREIPPATREIRPPHERFCPPHEKHSWQVTTGFHPPHNRPTMLAARPVFQKKPVGMLACLPPRMPSLLCTCPALLLPCVLAVLTGRLAGHFADLPRCLLPRMNLQAQFDGRPTKMNHKPT